MSKRSALQTFATILVLTLALPIGAFGQSTEESLKKNFPRLKVDSVQPSRVKGIYEVMSGDRILYYMPESEILIVGDLVDKSGRSLTQDRYAELASEKVKTIPLEKALKIGSGKNTIIEFTDPDCPYCRSASKFLDERSDVTRYIYFFPLPSHANAEPKIKYILCSTDQVKAYKEAMSGSLDSMKFKTCEDTKAAELAKEQREIGNRIGIRATPTFFINGKMVQGANQQLIKQYLEAAPPK